MGRALLGIVIGVVLVPLFGLAYLKYGHPPVAVSDAPWPYEKPIAGMALNARIEYEKQVSPPVKADGDTFIAGAHIYAQECAVCHGFHGQPSRYGTHMYPSAPPLWEKHHNGNVVGVSDDPVAGTYWKVSNGIRFTGMPSYKNILTDAQMWQVSVLLANADKPLPPEAISILNGQSSDAPVSDAANGSGAAILNPPAGVKATISHGVN